MHPMTKSHNSCKTCSITKSLLYRHLAVMLVSVCEYEHNPSRGVGEVAHTRFRVVRMDGWTDGHTEKCKSYCPATSLWGA